ncbi:MAG TPA: hypothetical protein VFB68_11035 [Xanthobacteraceae bacterium]|nr:hypothetical protein [Xanthobacteraceae bacterium]
MNSNYCRLVCVKLLTVIAVSTWIAAPGQADSFTPDHDDNGFNNSFERAVDLGELRPQGVNVKEQLGRVFDKYFDTRDFYRFMFPAGINDVQLSVRLEEEPDTSMWINIYDRSQKLVYSSRGSDNETFSIPLTSGLYYLEVLTDRDVANGRNLKYTLSARPVELPLPERGGLACKGAPSIGVLTDSGRQIEGEFNEIRRSSFYSFYVPYGSALTGGMQGLAPSSRYVLTVFDRLNGNRIAFRDSNIKEQGILLDPGFYCLQIESVGAAGLGNYRGRFAALRAGLVPGNDRQRAQNIIDMELGNLSRNGFYGFVSRYVHYQTPGQQPNVPTIIRHHHEYVIRDWVGNNASTQYYWFNLPDQSRVELRLFNQMASARAFVEDAQGNLLASTVVDGVSLDPELLPTQSLVATLPAGKTYYIRINYLSGSAPGTSFGVWMRASPPK